MSTDIDHEFDTLERLTPTDLREEIAERTRSPVSRPIPGPTPARRIAAAVVAVAVFASAAILGMRAIRHGEPQPAPAADPWAWAGEGWTELPAPPEDREGAAMVWTGTELLYWGGIPRGRDDGQAQADGFSLDPATRTWKPIPEAPAAGANGWAIWTGSEALFSLDSGWSAALAYDPAASAWRRMEAGPHDPQWGGAAVWTGTELIVFGGGPPDSPTTRKGAAYDPAADRWRLLPEAPVGLNLVDGAWDGSNVVVVGSLMDSGHNATTRSALAEAYDPSTDRWTSLPDPPISPQTAAVEFVDGRLVAWDEYNQGAVEYIEDERLWSSLGSSSLPANDICYTDGVAIEHAIVSWGCGHPVVWYPQTSSWAGVDPPIVFDDPALQYGWASVASAGSAAIVEQVETTSVGAEPYLGDPKAAVHLWLWRPASIPPAEPAPTSDDASDLVARFLYVLNDPGEAPYLPTLASAAFLESFSESEAGQASTDAGYDWRFTDRPFATNIGDERFASRVELGPRDNPIGEVRFIVAPGTPADGGVAQLVLTDAQML